MEYAEGEENSGHIRRVVDSQLGENDELGAGNHCDAGKKGDADGTNILNGRTGADVTWPPLKSETSW